MRAPSRIVGATLGICALVLLALPATSGADQVGRLRTARATLASKERSALLQLYALNTSLDRARGRLAAADGALETARRDRDLARQQLSIARRTLAGERSAHPYLESSEEGN